MIKHNALPWLALSAIVIALDLWTKHLALAHLAFHQPVPVIVGFWNWMLTFNTGAAFSFLADADGWQHWLFAVLAIVISGVLVFWLARTPRNDWRTALPFALVIGGALGNLHDRLRWGHVVDFVQWYWRDYYWPAFNIADSAIVAGAIGLVLFSLRQPKRG
jgi:signal peptidase II